MNVIVKVILVAVISTLIEQLVKKHLSERWKTKDSIKLFSFKYSKSNKLGSIEKTFSIKI